MNWWNSKVTEKSNHLFLWNIWGGLFYPSFLHDPQWLLLALRIHSFELYNFIYSLKYIKSDIMKSFYMTKYYAFILFFLEKWAGISAGFVSYAELRGSLQSK